MWCGVLCSSRCTVLCCVAGPGRRTLKIIPQFPISTDGSEIAVGDLAPGASVEVPFSVSADKSAVPGNYYLQIEASYKDDKAVKYVDTVDSGIIVQQKDLFNAVVVDYWFLWAIVVIVLAFVAIRRMNAMLGKKRKNQ